MMCGSTRTAPLGFARRTSSRWDIPNFAQIYETINHDKAVDAFAKTAFLKLNGGLGTSMGLDCAKSLLPVRRHKAKQMRFIDIILGQVETARNRLGVELPLTFMNSFRTSADTMKVLNRDKRFHQDDIPMEIIQHVEPKIDLSTGSRCHSPQSRSRMVPTRARRPVFDPLGIGSARHSRKPRIQVPVHLELRQSGARPSRTLAQHFENTDAPFMIEVSKRTEADRKGGHIVRDKVTGRLMLREMTQVAPEDAAEAKNIDKHPYFNTNNIWVRIDSYARSWHRATACSHCLSFAITRPSTQRMPPPPR